MIKLFSGIQEFAFKNDSWRIGVLVHTMAVIMILAWTIFPKVEMIELSKQNYFIAIFLWASSLFIFILIALQNERRRDRDEAKVYYEKIKAKKEEFLSFGNCRVEVKREDKVWRAYLLDGRKVVGRKVL